MLQRNPEAFFLNQKNRILNFISKKVHFELFKMDFFKI